MRHLALLALSLALPAGALAQPTSRANPFEESSAGRAWQRITFGAIDCGTNLSEAKVGDVFCPNDDFTQQGIFVNGTYKDLRFQYAGAPLGSESGVAENLANRVLNQSQTFPAASSASGFTFSWRGGATPSRDSEMFGPLFGDRGRTNGRRQLSATLTMQQLKWSTLDSFKVRDIPTTPSDGIGASGLPWGDPAYLVADGIAYGYVGRCEMNIDTSTITLALNYGLTDRLDFAVAVPLVRTTVEGSNEFLDFARFPDGSYSTLVADTTFEPQGRFFVTGSSTGLGDIAMQATLALVKSATAAVAVQGRVDLGTGDLQKMTGTGETHGGGGIIGSFESGRFSPHASAHYFAGGSTLFDEVRFTGGLDFNAVRDRVTLSGEVVGRRSVRRGGVRAGHAARHPPVAGHRRSVRGPRLRGQPRGLRPVLRKPRWQGSAWPGSSWAPPTC